MKHDLQEIWSLKQKPVGPLINYLAPFANRLVEQGYCRRGIGAKVRVIAKFSHWLHTKKISAHNVTPVQAKQFFQDTSQQNAVKRGEVATLSQLIKFLQQKGISQQIDHPVIQSSIQQIIDSFGHYILVERCLSPKTLVQYRPFIEYFLTERFRKDPVRLSSLSGKDIISFIKHQAEHRSTVRMKVAITALRSFLRYAVYHDNIDASLIEAVPTVASWSVTSIPKAISPDHIQRVLAHCHRDTAIGKRDYAILMILAHLGLRAGEIVALTLDSIDWEASSITISGKGNQSVCLPLPVEVGEAVVDYLQLGRPRCNERTLFLRTLAPIQGLGAQQTIGTIVNAAIVRAGIEAPSRGAHQFRHAVATNMLRQGASLTEIGCILRHKHPKTTNIYAKVDIKLLRSLALAIRRCIMNLQEALADYLAMRRGLGFKLHTEGTALVSFVSFLEQYHKDIITTELALIWAKLPSIAQPAQWARRLSYVRSFARYCRAIDLISEVPPSDLLPISYQRPAPFIFTDRDIRRLLLASQQLSVKESFFTQTLYCLFGLLSVTGLRIREALNLTLDDVELETGILIVRETKFGKSRLLPIHSTTVNILAEYREQRERFMTGKQLPYWFVNRKKEHLGYDCVKYHFDNLLKLIGVRRQIENRRPHLHDLRHYFALSVLIRWYRDGEDVERRLPILSTYLGHVETRDTYWYLSACPELMNAAKERLEKHWEHRV